MTLLLQYWRWKPRLAAPGMPPASSPSGRVRVDVDGERECRQEDNRAQQDARRPAAPRAVSSSADDRPTAARSNSRPAS